MKKEGHLLLRVRLKLKGIEHRELARMMDVCPAYLDAQPSEIPELFPESDCNKVVKMHI